MVSFYQTDQFGIKQVLLHERETSSSGRPKPIQVKEDADNFYVYSRSGQLTQVRPKTDNQKYWDFLANDVIYENWSRAGGVQRGTYGRVINNVLDDIRRITPATEYEIEMGYGAINIHNIGIKWGSNNLEHDRKKLMVKTQELAEEHLIKQEEAQQIADEQRLHKLRDTARPNPREVEKVEPIEIEPIKEAVKYSPLMIAGILVIVVILLLKRRRA